MPTGRTSRRDTSHQKRTIPLIRRQTKSVNPKQGLIDPKTGKPVYWRRRVGNQRTEDNGIEIGHNTHPDSKEPSLVSVTVNRKNQMENRGRYRSGEISALRSHFKELGISVRKSGEDFRLFYSNGKEVDFDTVQELVHTPTQGTLGAEYLRIRSKAAAKRKDKYG